MIIKIALWLSIVAAVQGNNCPCPNDCPPTNANHKPICHKGNGGGQGNVDRDYTLICPSQQGYFNGHLDGALGNGNGNGHQFDKFIDEIIVVDGDEYKFDAECNLVSTGGSGQGDPHFKTWTGHGFDFHGQCDLVFLDIPNFANGLGLKIHIRTKIHRFWSSIDVAVLQIGHHTLEVTGDKNHLDYWINGGERQKFEVGTMASLADFPVHFEKDIGGTSQVNIDIGDGDWIRFSNFIGFLQVKVMPKTARKFQGSVGLMGSFPDGKTVGRDKVTIIEDGIEFGQEWQVLDSEAMLFREPGDVQHPTKCVLPGRHTVHRRLGESAVSEEEAAEACAGVAKEDNKACIFDVMATQNKAMVGVYD